MSENAKPRCLVDSVVADVQYPPLPHIPRSGEAFIQDLQPVHYRPFLSPFPFYISVSFLASRDSSLHQNFHNTRPNAHYPTSINMAQYDVELPDFASLFSLEGRVAVVTGGSRGLGISLFPYSHFEVPPRLTPPSYTRSSRRLRLPPSRLLQSLHCLP